MSIISFLSLSGPTTLIHCANIKQLEEEREMLKRAADN